MTTMRGPMSQTGKYDKWLVRIEHAQMHRDPDTRLQMVRMQLNTFSVDGDSFRPLSFHIPRGDEEKVVDGLCDRFGVNGLGALKDKWATITCPLEKGKIVGIHPATQQGNPVMVMGRAEARRITRERAN